MSNDPGGCSCDHCGVIFVGLESDDGACPTCRAISVAYPKWLTGVLSYVGNIGLHEAFDAGYRANVISDDTLRALIAARRVISPMSAPETWGEINNAIGLAGGDKWGSA